MARSTTSSAAPIKDLRPLYAAAGLADLIAEGLRQRLDRNRAEAARRWADLKEKAPVLPQVTIERLVTLPSQAGGYLSQAEDRYSELAGRGKTAVDGAWQNAQQLREQAGQRLRGTIGHGFGRATDGAPLPKWAQKYVRPDQPAEEPQAAQPETEQPAKNSAQSGSATKKAATTKASTAKKTAAKKTTTQKPSARKQS